jgi:rubrerythrin
MNTKAKSALQALEDAKCVEQQGQEFYRKAVDITQSEKGKKLFLSLVEDEVMHERLIQRQIDHVTAEGTWAELHEGAEAPDCDISQPVFPPLEKELGELRADTTDIDAVLMALEFEAKIYEMYRQAAEETSEPAALQTFEFLAAQERLHFDLLMSNYEAMVPYGGWVD